MSCEHCQGKKKRTNTQNRALHKYFSLLSEALNDAGYDIRETLRKEVDMPWTPITVKEYIWKAVQKAYMLEQSTTKMTTKDIDKIYDIVNRMVGERTQVHVPFPSAENLLQEERFNELKEN